MTIGCTLAYFLQTCLLATPSWRCRLSSALSCCYYSCAAHNTTHPHPLRRWYSFHASRPAKRDPCVWSGPKRLSPAPVTAAQFRVQASIVFRVLPRRDDCIQIPAHMVAIIAVAAASIHHSATTDLDSMMMMRWAYLRFPALPCLALPAFCAATGFNKLDDF